MNNMLKKIFPGPSPWLLLIGLFMGLYVGLNVTPNWVVKKQTLDVEVDKNNSTYFIFKDKPVYIDSVIHINKSNLNDKNIRELNSKGGKPKIEKEYVFEYNKNKKKKVYYKLTISRHWGYWSLLPGLITIVLCWLLKDPLVALLAGVVCGGFILGRFDFINEVFLPSLMSKSAAGILILYLWLLGALMGIWAKTGATRAFAEYATKKWVKGPRSAKLVAWLLGVIFFQGGTISAVLVGTTVRPIADKQNISHEELSYIVDSTSAPIATLLAFNAWPAYVQGLIFVSGVGFLATEADRMSFFFRSIPFSFYAFFAVLGTFLLSLDKAPLIGKKLKNAIKRSRKDGELNAPGAQPLSAKELETNITPKDYEPNVMDFFLPLFVLIATVIFTFIQMGSPKVRIAFGLAVLTGALLALFKGMSLYDLMSGIGEGLKGVVYGSMILLFAITIGRISQETGAGIYLVELLGQSIPYLILPLTFQIMAMIIAFSTGTSWGTYAVAFPLAMPLAWAVAMNQGVANPEIYMMICFATILNGSIYGDQCSPISDTTILSSLATGCDLMDHVKTQILPASYAALIAGVLWTISTILLV